MELFNDNNLKFNSFHEIFSDLLSTSFDDWFKAISYFKSEFVTAPMTEKFEYFSKRELKISNAEHFYLTGFDMPCWVGPEKFSKKIMILASEPRRNEKTWTKGVNKYEFISLNTPFSYHKCNIATIKNPKEKDNYWDLIRDMIKKYNSIIYMTDIRKIWFAGWEHYSEYKGAKIHLEIFFKELVFFQPDLIIVFGSVPLKILQATKKIKHEIELSKKDLQKEGYSFDGKYKILPLVHPSDLASVQRKQFFERNGVLKEGLKQNEMYMEIIKRFVI